jgi:hypothetical protein
MPRDWHKEAAEPEPGFVSHLTREHIWPPTPEFCLLVTERPESRANLRFPVKVGLRWVGPPTAG